MKLINSVIIEGRVMSDSVTIINDETNSSNKIIQFCLTYESHRIRPNGTVEKETSKIPCRIYHRNVAGKASYDEFFSAEHYTDVRLVGRISADHEEVSDYYSNLHVVVEHIERKATA